MFLHAAKATVIFTSKTNINLNLNSALSDSTLCFLGDSMKSDFDWSMCIEMVD